MKGPAVWLWELLTVTVRSVSAAGKLPVCAWYIETDDAETRKSA